MNMKITASIRKFVARIIASNRYSRVLFKRIALDEHLFSLILKDPLCKKRVSGDSSLNKQISLLATPKPLPETPKKTAIKERAKQIFEPITDISIGINWGPAAFPLTRHAVYFREGMRQLTERWLRRLPSDAFVILLADASEIQAAQVLAKGYRQVKKIIEVPLEADEKDKEGDFRQALTAVKAPDAILVPLTAENRPIEFIPGNTMPDLVPYYPLVRRLRRLGFRQYALYSFHGLRQMEIPLQLDDFVNKHKGRRCFVAGNGPSLNQIDMGLIQDEITLGSNRCYYGFDKWGFAFNYWACVDRLQLEEYGLEYQDQVPESTVKFIPFEYSPLLQFPNCCPVNFDYEWRPPYKFSGSPDVLHLGFTVTHALLQIAYIMGCNPIYLIGVDHRYNLNSATMQDRSFGEKKAKIWIAEDSTKPTHFTDQYTGGEAPKLFITPKPEKAEACFEVARNWTREHGVDILNATPNSALEVFPKVDFNSLF